MNSKMDYKSHGNDHFWWIDKAEELLISSMILEEAYGSGMAKVKNGENGVLPNECRTLSVFIYLRALAIELYLKATILKSGKELVTDERYVGKNHSLQALAQDAKISLNSSERALLSKLTESINYWGRYPIPKTKDSWRRKVEGVEGVQPVWTWSEEELKVCDALLQRLREPL
jgi:hypothetical protein